MEERTNLIKQTLSASDRNLEQDQLIRSIFYSKVSPIFKNVMSKVRHVQDKGTWIPPFFRATPWTNIGVLQNSKTTVSLLRRIGLLRREPQPTMVVTFLKLKKDSSKTLNT